MRTNFTGRLRAALLIWTGLTLLPAWLVTIRGLFDGEDYAWGVTDEIKGRGTSGYYFIAPLTALFGLSILALGWRGAMRPFHIMLAAWNVPLGILASLAALRNQEALRLRGDTLGVDVSLAHIAPAALGSVAAGSVALAALDKPGESEVQRKSPNRSLLTIALAVVPIQFLLLRAGKQHGLTDKFGVILTISQWALINVGLAKRSPSGTLPTSLPVQRA